MSRSGNKSATDSVDPLLKGAAVTMANAPYCWLVTSSEGGDFGVRPMGRLPREQSDDEWTIRFLTDGRSPKAAHIRRNPRATVLFQHCAADGYVKAAGRVRLREDPEQIGRWWRSAYEVYFPGEGDRAHAAFVEIEVDRLELWIRGVTPEPFGLLATFLERTASSDWRLAPSESAIAL